MTTIRAIVQEGRIQFPAPKNFPEGAEVFVSLSPAPEKIGLDESEWDDTAQGAADWIEWLDSLEPLIFTEQELVKLEADRQARRQWEKEQFADHADQLSREYKCARGC